MTSYGVAKIMDLAAFVAPEHQSSPRTISEEYEEIA